MFINLRIFLMFIFFLPYLLFKKTKDRKLSPLNLYGIIGFFGLPGAGKTMTMSYYLRRMRKKYGDQIYIMTNYHYSDQDFQFTSWKDLLKPYDKPLICAWDEIQNEFNSRDFKNFPIALMTQLTQVRKGHGIQILYTAQRWHFVDKNFRSLTNGSYDCKTFLGNFTIAKLYDPYDYDQLCQTVDVNLKRHIRPKSFLWFLQSDSLRDCYDSFKMLETAKSKEYMDREEIAKISLEKD